MRIAVVSDIHDHLRALDDALAAARDAGARALLCCGDLCAPFVVPALAGGVEGPVHIVFGNNDGDPFRIARVAAEHPNVTIHGEFARLEIDGRRIALHHFREVGREVARNGRHDIVCYGHTHEAEIERLGDTLALNPGEVMGRLGSPSLAIYDTGTGEAEIVESG